MNRTGKAMTVPLGELLELPPQNGYSPVCPNEPTGKWVLGLSALDGRGLDLAGAKPAPTNDPLVDRFFLKEGDFVISRSNTLEKVGRIGVFRGGLENCSYPDLMMRFRPKYDLINPDYLEICLRSDEAVKYIQRRATGTSGSMKKINKSIVEALPIQLLPLDIQRRVSDVALSWGLVIEKTEQLIAAKEKHKFAVSASLLSGKRRLQRFKQPWKKWHLGELFYERVETGQLSLPLLSITREEGIIPHADAGRKDSSSDDKSKYLRICPGDIGYNTMRMWQGVSALSRYEGLVSPAYTICTPGPNIDGKFASYLFKCPVVVNLFYRYSQGLTSDTWNLKYHHFAEIKVNIPPVDEQVAIASFLSGLDDELAVLNKTKEALVKQKRGLMQKLLIGEWRLKEKMEAQV